MLVGTLTLAQQQRMLELAREVINQAPLYTAQMPNGSSFRYKQTGAGYGWTSGFGGGYRYQRSHPVTGQELPDIPEKLLTLARHYKLEADALLVNVYDNGSTLGLHQAKDEKDLTAPVISISLGDTANFKIGGRKRSDSCQTLQLVSGSVMTLAGEDRLRFHGVAGIISGTSPIDGLQGRINLTLRRSQ